VDSSLPPFYDFDVMYNAAMGRGSELNSLHTDFDEFLIYKLEFYSLNSQYTKHAAMLPVA